MASQRMRRVNETMREVIAESISGELDDPRLGFVTVTDVEASSDLRHAKVFVSVLGSEEERDASIQALDAATGILQAAINREMHIKRTPALEINYDDTGEQAERVTRILEQ